MDDKLDVPAFGLESVMHSQGMRARVRDLHFVQGVGMRTIGAMSGMPTRRTVRLWVCRPRYSLASRRYGASYTLETRLGVVRVFALTGDVKAAAASAGCSPSSVYAWAHAHLEEGGAGLAMGLDEDAPDAGGVEALHRQVEALWLDNAVMRETIRVLKADDSRLGPSMLTNRSRTRVIDAIRGEFGLARALQATGLKRGTYYYERGVIAAGDRYAVLRACVAGLSEKGGRVWRYRYLHRMLPSTRRPRSSSRGRWCAGSCARRACGPCT